MSSLRILLSEAEIAARVETLAGEIASTVPDDFIMVGLLKGAFVFFADLARALDRVGARPEIEFMRLSSYGLATVSRGEVRLLGDAPSDIEGRNILLIDDIVDTGRSVAFAADLLRRRKIGGLWTCALLDKPQRREVEAPIDFIGFGIEDVFVAGYGIDHAEKHRHLPYIGVID